MDDMGSTLYHFLFFLTWLNPIRKNGTSTTHKLLVVAKKETDVPPAEGEKQKASEKGYEKMEECFQGIFYFSLEGLKPIKNQLRLINDTH